ncbi:hypothetical protein ABFX02_06G163900 [Erythranthe guttata]
MSISHFSSPLTLLTLTAILLLQTNYSVCTNPNSFNASLGGGFSSAIATWYGSPEGPGTTGGACGFGVDVQNPPYNSLVSAGSNDIYLNGKGCGACYQVKCTENSACSGFPVTVTITDHCPSCPGAFHFDLSGKAFGYLAKRGQADQLRNAGGINIQYQRVACNYKTGILFKIDAGSTANYMAFAIELVSGDGDIGAVQLLPSNTGAINMQQSWGATWKADLPNGTKGPFTVKVTTIESRRTITATNVIPANWSPGQYYHSGAN